MQVRLFLDSEERSPGANMLPKDNLRSLRAFEDSGKKDG